MLELYKITLSSELNKSHDVALQVEISLGFRNATQPHITNKVSLKGSLSKDSCYTWWLPQDAIKKDNINISVKLVNHMSEIRAVGCFYVDFAFMDIWISTFHQSSSIRGQGCIIPFHSQKGRFHRLFLSFALACRFIVAMSLFSYKVQCYYCRTDILM